MLLCWYGVYYDCYGYVWVDGETTKVEVGVDAIFILCLKLENALI